MDYEDDWDYDYLEYMDSEYGIYWDEPLEWYDV